MVQLKFEPIHRSRNVCHHKLYQINRRGVQHPRAQSDRPENEEDNPHPNGIEMRKLNEGIELLHKRCRFARNECKFGDDRDSWTDTR